jgi:hypothetical protein
MDPRAMVAALGTEAVTVPAGRISMMEAAGGWATTRNRTSLLRAARTMNKSGGRGAGRNVERVDAC